MKNRILSLSLSNIKCVSNGTIRFSNYGDVMHGDLTSLEKSSVLGLYGQNGSGKTTAYDCFRFLKFLSLGVPLYQKTQNGIMSIENFDFLLNINSKVGNIEYEFLIFSNKKPYKVNYSVELKSKNKLLFISKENIVVYRYHENGETWKYPFAPLTINYEDNRTTLLYDGVEHKNNPQSNSIKDINVFSSLLAEKLNCMSNGLSFVLSNTNINYLLSNQSEDVKTFGKVVKELKEQLVGHLYTFKTNKEGLSEIGLGTLLGVHFDQKKKTMMHGEFQFSLLPFTIQESQREAYDHFIKEINIFISSFVPGFQLGIQLIGKGSHNGVNVQIITINRIVGNSNLPLSQESSGIRKLISLTCALAYVYGDSDGWLIIDEFDSGVFEELLGQIVYAIQQNGKGQLLFTAHNLRPLERIESNCIVFTTANPNNRYIVFKNLSKTSNLRDCYFRALKLGGQSEELSSFVDDDEIDLALFDAFEALKRTEDK